MLVEKLIICFFFLSIFFVMFPFLLQCHISYSIFYRLHRYGNEQNVFTCVCVHKRESIRNKSTTSEHSHPIFFQDIFFNLSTCLHVLGVPSNTVEMWFMAWFYPKWQHFTEIMQTASRIRSTFDIFWSRDLPKQFNFTSQISIRFQRWNRSMENIQMDSV